MVLIPDYYYQKGSVYTVCGIAGLLDVSGKFNKQELTQAVMNMTGKLVHRGPDDQGIFCDEESQLVFGHQRLAIIDPTPQGAQPMTTRDGRFTITYNGELYNTRELYADNFKNIPQRGHCDTEIVLQMLAAKGEQALTELNGMFALAFYDSCEGKLILARDRFGQKPLYYTVDNKTTGRFAFASELQAITVLPDYQPEINRDALAQYLLLQYIHAPETIYNNIQKLPPGTYITVTWGKNNNISAEIKISDPIRYYSWPPSDDIVTPVQIISNPENYVINQDRVAQLDKIIQAAVHKRMVSDVPLGALLSGGVDSTLIVAMMQKLSGQPVKTFSIGFTNSEESEHEQARLTSELLGTVHSDQIISPDIHTLMPEIVNSLDEPLGDSSCLPTWCLSRMVREHVKVALSGDGGDELFGGYQRYAHTIRENESRLWRLRWWLKTRTRWTAAVGYCSQRWWMLMPDEISQLLDFDWNKADSAAVKTANWMRSSISQYNLPLIQRMRYLDAASYMPGAVLAKVDRMSMAHSLEIRSPFLDPDVAQFAATLSPRECYTHKNAILKPLLRELLKKYVPQQWAERPKRGFGLPAAGWSHKSMLSMCDELILSANSRCAEHMDTAALSKWIEHQRNPYTFSVYQVWTMLILELWLRKMKVNQ